MKQFIPPVCLLATLFFAACGGKSPEIPTAEATASTAEAANTKHCYMLAEGKDTTTVSLTVNADNTVTGEMTWSPYEKDGADGTLKGTKNAAGELEVLYSYTIEGSNQTETKVMKEEGGNLKIKTGELEDVKFNGNMTYKDVTKAKYTETLIAVPCK